MFARINAAIDRFRGTGDASIAIPLFDGALKPNSLLDDAAVFAVADGLSDMAVAADGAIYLCAGAALLKATKTGECQQVAGYAGPILAVASAGEYVALAFEDGLRVLDDKLVERSDLQALEKEPLTCITALAFSADGQSLYVTRGSTSCDASGWKRDLLTHGRSGQLLRLDLESRSSELLATDLRWPNGVVERPDGTLLISEAWEHRLLSVAADGSTSVAYPNLPGYPARMSRTERGGGYWLSLFAKRTQLIEFVLREPAFRKAMLKTIPQQYWIAPSYHSGGDFLEPLQFGAVRQMGILKPWAPSNSYGVAVRLSEELVPQFSCHSRAGGKHHGTVSAIEHRGQLYVVSRGSNSVLTLPADAAAT